MNNCSEYVLDDMVAITAIPIDDYEAIGSTSLEPTIKAADFAPSLINAIVVGIYPAEAGGVVIPIVKSTGKVKDSESKNVAGRSHNVNVECDIDDRDASLWPVIVNLERNAYHLLLTLRDGTRTFVQATEDSYMCTSERGSGKTSLTFKVHNMMGMQLIVE